MENILTTFNSFYPNVQFTIDQFSVNNIHFLDIQNHPCSTTVYRKSAHTGQYQHIVNRAHKSCSNETLLKDELQRMLDFMIKSWNCFPYKLSMEVVEQFNHDHRPS